jgi:hypothetical protein
MSSIRLRLSHFWSILTEASTAYFETTCKKQSNCDQISQTQDRSICKVKLNMKMREAMHLLLVIAGFAALPVHSNGQALANSGDSSFTVAPTTPTHTILPYARPTEKTRLRNYFFDVVGPYPIVGTALSAGINQAEGTPPEWQQSAAGYGKRFGSNLGIEAVSTTTRYALARAFREDTLYYRCECKGVFPRLGHAVISTVTARRGDDGHRVFSFPALVAPYAGTMAAVYGWYPGRYDARDAFRMGNYSLLGYVGGNLAREFLYNVGPHTFLSHLHRHHGHGAPDPSSNP